MRIIAILSSSLLLNGIASVVPAAEVSRSLTSDATAAEVWEQVGPFCAIADWYPGIESCTEEMVDGVRHRRLTTGDGAVFLERLLSHDDAAMRYSYAIIEGPLPVADYSADFRVTPSDGGAQIVWESTFEPAGVTEEEAVGVITSVYNTGLEALKSRFAK